MDDRQRQIQEGAGLVESRLNTAFIDWLRKWSTPLLVVAAVAMLAFMGWQRLEEARRAKVNRAFADLAAASQGSNPSPDSLRGVADEYDGVRGVSHLARLAAADIYLQSVRRGLKIGRDPSTTNAEDLLSAEDRENYLRECESLYTLVHDQTEGSSGMLIHAIGAAFGLGAVAECRGDMEAATRWYERAKALAERDALATHVRIAEDRIASLATLQAPNLPNRTQPDPATPSP